MIIMFIPKFKSQIISLKKNKQTFKSRKKSTKITNLRVGNFGIGSNSYSLITYGQLEMVRRFIARRLNKKSKKIIRISLTHRLYKKPNKSRMGKGIGKFYRWYGYIKPGQILFEFNSLKKITLIESIFYSLKKKTPFTCFIVHSNLKFKFCFFKKTK